MSLRHHVICVTYLHREIYVCHLQGNENVLRSKSRIRIETVVLVVF